MVASKTRKYGHIPLEHSDTICQVNGNVTHPYAYLEVDMKQEQNSWEIVTEIDPLNVGEILGSIGGFWGESTVVQHAEDGAFVRQIKQVKYSQILL